MTTTSFSDLPPGAPNPVRVKFMTGFNQGYRHARLGAPLGSMEITAHSTPFQAAYPLGIILGRSEQTTETVMAKLEEAWIAYHGGHHGARMEARPDLLRGLQP